MRGRWLETRFSILQKEVYTRVSPRVEPGGTFVAFELFCGFFHDEARNKPCNLGKKGYIFHGGLLIICNPSIRFAGEKSSLHFLYTRGAVKMTAPRNFGTGVLRMNDDFL